MRRREEREDSPFDDENGEDDIDKISISNYSKRYQGSTSHSNYPPIQVEGSNINDFSQMRGFP